MYASRWALNWLNWLNHKKTEFYLTLGIIAFFSFYFWITTYVRYWFPLNKTAIYKSYIIWIWQKLLNIFFFIPFWNNYNLFLYPLLILFLFCIWLYLTNASLKTIKLYSLYLYCSVFLFYFSYFIYNLNLLSIFSFYKIIQFDLFFNLKFCWFLDNLNFYFILLTCFLFPICLLLSWNTIFYKLKLYIFIFTILEFFLILTFISTNLFFFFFFFWMYNDSDVFINWDLRFSPT